jgi:putative DNA primase/helicase
MERDVARDLFDRGLSLVPVEAGTKNHPRVSWKRYQSVRADWSEISAWLNRWPDTNLAIVTGAISNLLVLDLDSDDAVAEARRRGLPRTLEVATARGRHVYFRYPGREVRNRTHVFPGADIRGDGGYVISPGSRHPSGADYVICRDNELAEMPAWLADILSPDEPPQGDELSTDDDAVGRTVAKALSDVEQAAEGTRNEALNRSAFRLGQLSTRIDAEEVRASLKAVALDAGLTATEVARTIDSGWKKGARSPRGPSEGATCAEDYDEVMEAIGSVGRGDITGARQIVDRAGKLDPLQRETVLKRLAAQTGASLATLRAQVRYLQAGDGADHLATARQVVENLGAGDLFYADGTFWLWSKAGVWKEANDRYVKREIQHLIEASGEKVTANLVNSVMDVLKSEVFRPHHRFNIGPPDVVNCTNGPLELVDYQWCLKRHRREHFRTAQIPVAYDPDAKAPRFRQFLSEIFRDDPDRADKIDALLELMGYTLMAHAKHEKFAILIGTGANGKSVLLTVLEALCGSENISAVQPAKFDSVFQRAHMDQKLANIITEVRQGEVIADAELKAITSGEPSTVEHKNRPPYVMRPHATCWFGANHMPHTRDFSDALFRRAVILRFNRVFEPREQDTDLKDKLIAELPGILSMALEAYATALLAGFTVPASAKDAKLEWRKEADQVAEFAEERCISGPLHRTTIGTLFVAYQDWAREQGIAKLLAKKGFRDRLNRLGFGDARTANERWVTGVKLRIDDLNDS